MAGRRLTRAKRLGAPVTPLRTKQGIQRRVDALEERLAQAKTAAARIAAAADFLRGVTKLVTPATADMIAAEVVQVARRHARRIKNTRTGGGAVA